VEIPVPARVQVVATPCVASPAPSLSTIRPPTPTPLPTPRLVPYVEVQPVSALPPSALSPAVNSLPLQRFAWLAFVVGWLYLFAPINILAVLVGWDAHDFTDEAFNKGTATRHPSENSGKLPVAQPEQATGDMFVPQLEDLELYFSALQQAQAQAQAQADKAILVELEHMRLKAVRKAEADKLYAHLPYGAWLQSTSYDPCH